MLNEEITSINRLEYRSQYPILYSSIAESIKVAMHLKFSSYGHFRNFYNIHIILIIIAHFQS